MSRIHLEVSIHNHSQTQSLQHLSRNDHSRAATTPVQPADPRLLHASAMPNNSPLQPAFNLPNTRRMAWVTRRWFNHYVLVLLSMVVRIHSASLKRFQAQFQRKEVYHATTRMSRSKIKQVFPCALPACILGQQTAPSSSNCRPSFANPLPNSLSGVCISWRAHVSCLAPLHVPTSCTALSRSPRPVLACRARRPLQANRPKCPLRHRGRRSSSVSQLPASSSIEALATKSSARQYFSAGSSSSEPVVSTSVLFRVSPSTTSISVWSPVSKMGYMSLDLFVALTIVESGVLFLKRRRLTTGVHSVSGSTFTASDSGRIKDDLVPAEEDPPLRSVSPVSAIVGLSSVSSGGLPRRTRPCPSHGSPFTRISEETSTR